MVKVVLPDDSELELPDGATGLDAARAIGPKLAEQAVLLRSNGSVRDLRLPVEEGERIQILTTRDKDDPDALYVLRHSAAHLLAEAARRLFPGTKVAIGPPIENGFYYDFEFPEPVTEADLQRLEDEVRAEAQTAAAAQIKQIEDAAAYIRSLAQLRGRNAEWGEQAVRDAVSLSAADALGRGVIDLVVRDTPELLDKLVSLPETVRLRVLG